MRQNVAEGALAEGVYDAHCVGPATEEEGRRIADYVREHPGFAEEHGGYANMEAARILGIPLVSKWQSQFHNLVTTVGKNLALDTLLAGAAYTVTGPYLGLISSVSYTTGPAAGDTMAAHGGWLEAGSANAPTYTRPRQTAAFSAASGGSKATSAAAVFSISGNGTAKGAFLVLGTGALSQIDSTAGTLYSAGLFAGGDRILQSGDTLNVSWTGSM